MDNPHRRRRALRLVLACLIGLLPAACGGGAPQPPAATAQPSTGTDQPPAPAETQAPPVAPPTGDLQERISNSLNLTFGLEGVVLPSFHLEVDGAEPVYNSESKQIETKSFAYQADVAGDDVHLITKTKTGEQPEETTEGFIIDGGLAATDSGGKEFEIVNGQIQDSFGMSLAWASLPLGLIFPLTIAAAGPAQFQGEENLDGRAAEKYIVDSRGAPAGVIESVGGIFGFISSQATVWIDKETGALLKMIADYEQEVTDLSGSGEPVGAGTGHIELEVTGIGSTTVTPPEQ
jgi:hypothetical protein